MVIGLKLSSEGQDSIWNETGILSSIFQINIPVQLLGRRKKQASQMKTMACKPLSPTPTPELPPGEEVPVHPEMKTGHSNQLLQVC